MNTSRQGGITLIERVVVITILGILASFASVSAPLPANCSVSYSTAVVGSAPAVIVDLSGC